MSKWEENVRKVVPYTPGEQPKVQNIIKLNTNENPYPPSPLVEQAWKELDLASLRKYPDPAAYDLTKAIADIYGVKKEQTFVGVGSDDVIAMAFLTFFNSKKPILFPDITYSFYDVWADMLRIPYETKALDADFCIRVEDYFGENGGIIFPNPNAPTGVLMSLEKIREIVEHNRDVVVIVDEAYIDFGGESALPLIEEYDNVLITQTFSKSRSLAGLRIGAAFGSEKLISYLQDVKYSFNSYTMNEPAIRLGTAAAKDQAYFESCCEKIIATRERMKVALKELGFVFADSMSNFLFITHPTVECVALFEALREAHIYVRHFSKPERIRPYLRVTIGTDEEMDCFLNFVRDFVEKNS